MDSLVVSLCKWTTLLDPNVPKPTVAFGEHPKACMAMEVVFQVAHRWGGPGMWSWFALMQTAGCAMLAACTKQCIIWVHSSGLSACLAAMTRADVPHLICHSWSGPFRHCHAQGFSRGAALH